MAGCRIDQSRAWQPFIIFLDFQLVDTSFAIASP
jgi:hypothetical protein